MKKYNTEYSYEKPVDLDEIRTIIYNLDQKNSEEWITIFDENNPYYFQVHYGIEYEEDNIQDYLTTVLSISSEELKEIKALYLIEIKNMKMIVSLNIIARIFLKKRESITI